MNNLVKFAGGGILIVLVGVGVLIGIRYWRYRTDPAYQAEQAAYEYIEQEQKLIQQMKDDPYGGETPEETLRLFIDALKQGDTDLAAKYFVVGEQEKWREYLSKEKGSGNIGQIIIEAEKLELSRKDEREAFFTVANKNNVVEVIVILKKGLNAKWKITEL
ncbi:MAG: hypothetical protein HY617_00740 [Candidatus Sungbacteria bacterium]|nr:hypothetical protein [Candidatus Sungbacteria bacterium]